MVGNKLKDLFETEVKRYLEIPYARNFWSKGLLESESIFGGKGNWRDIEYATKCAAVKDNLSIKKLSPQQVYDLQLHHHIGIDCSGLAYHLLDELDRIKGGPGILFKVTGIDRHYGTLGVRAISASDLTHTHNSQLIKNYDQVLIGDLIRHHNGTHILVITDTEPGKIHYVHSSLNTLTEGVHLGRIEIKDSKLPLNFQEWTDTYTDGVKYQELSNPENYDGIYRLKCWL